ncbi:MAG: type II toxin-antitoxin system RelE/ParE family toxin, partial [Treponema sp.]|nr:type II toxin-antitoxin system RelE/ParE family toxin [Treponema sp.]
EIVNQLENGQYDADLGGEVYKVRVARPGRGKSGGYRVIVIFKSMFRTFFAFGFPKSKMGDIGDKVLKVFKSEAKDNLASTDEQINRLLKSQVLIEIL